MKQKGRESHLSEQQQAALCAYINQYSQSDEGGRLTGESIHQYLTEHYGVTYHTNAIYKLLKRLGFAWITSRSRPSKQSQIAQDEFKKLQIETIKLLPGHIALDKVIFGFRTRLGLANKIRQHGGYGPRKAHGAERLNSSLSIAICLTQCVQRLAQPKH